MTRTSATPRPQELQAVASVPRLFVGQVPINKSEDELLPVFAEYGQVETVVLMRGPDQKSKGCAMIEFKKWSEAEAAMDALNGACPFDENKGRPIVVNFANPRRASGGSLESVIAPRKLFIGNVSKDCTEQNLYDLFGKYGAIQSINIADSKGPAGRCAFVQFKKWAGCEEAIEALHGTHVMLGSDVPLVVKFADAKRGGVNQIHYSPSVSPFLSNGTNNPNHVNQFPPPHFLQQGGPQQPQLSNDSSQSYAMAPGGKRSGGTSTSTVDNNNNNNNNYFIMPHPGVPYHHPDMMSHMGMGMQPPQMLHHPPGSPFSPQAMGIPLSPHHSPGYPASWSGRNGKPGSNHGPNTTTTTTNGRNTLGSSITNGSSDSLGDISDGSEVGQFHTGPMQISMQEMMHQQYMNAMAAAGYVGYPMIGVAPPMPGMPGMPGMPFGVGHKVGRGVSDTSVYSHKLFIGQVPFEATEQDLWHMFATFGEILELAVLRSGGVSKGCAFLTYATKQQAMHAMAAMHGQPLVNNKRLVVKFADNRHEGSS